MYDTVEFESYSEFRFGSLRVGWQGGEKCL